MLNQSEVIMLQIKRLLTILTIVGLLSGMGWLLLPRQQTSALHVLVLYAGEELYYHDTVQHFQQSLIIGLTVESRNIASLAPDDLKRAQVVYLDGSIAGHHGLAALQPILLSYVEGGGAIFMENELYQDFPLDFTGAKAFVPLNQWPSATEYPQVSYNLQPVQAVFQDFFDIASRFSVHPAAPGMAMIPAQAQPLAQNQGLGLCTVNQYGQGWVFFASSLLPNKSYINGFDMTAKNDSQQAFNPSISASNYLIKNEFAAFVAKQRNGYVVKKVLGPNGRPAMAWQNHFEVLSAVSGHAMREWTNLLKGYQQIPSFSLARSLYEWGVWKESVVYHLNRGSNSQPKYYGEEENSHYGSGHHATVGDNYLTQASYPEYRSLGEPTPLPVRAHPAVADLNRDGILDLLCGSADGGLYLYYGTSRDPHWQLSAASRPLQADGRDIRTTAYSAPCLYDLNLDGALDLLLGGANGQVLTYLNCGPGRFEKARKVGVVPPLSRLTAPAVGDVDQDGVADLLIGTESGELFLLKGQLRDGTIQFLIPAQRLAEAGGKSVAAFGLYTAPAVLDYDGDGQQEIICGSADGYIRKYKFEAGQIVSQGLMEGLNNNPSGNKGLLNGRNSVPCVADINQDGIVDLITGQLEFGVPVPIDSPAFPYHNELREDLNFLAGQGIEVMPHISLHNFKNTTQEQIELDLHQKAFEHYGLPWGTTGANQHTWRINQLDSTQTLNSEFARGIWWNSGFRPANQIVEPTLGTEYARVLPFRLVKEELPVDMLILNGAPNASLYPDLYAGIARFDLPISYFAHVEYGVLKPDQRQGLLDIAAFLSSFRDDYLYNFMTETQMMKSILANLKADIKCNDNNPLGLWNQSDQAQPFHLQLCNNTQASDQKIGLYSQTVGVKVEVGEALLNQKLVTDAPIYCRVGHDLYLSVAGTVTVSGHHNLAEKDSPHVVRANLPVVATPEPGKLTINIQDQGLQQVVIYSSAVPRSYSSDWLLEQSGDYYTFTRFGQPCTLEISLT